MPTPKPAKTRELVAWRLRQVKRGRSRNDLATLVTVHGAVAPAYAVYVAFEDRLVEDVGRVLSKGCGPHAPARMMLYYLPLVGSWLLWVRYVDDHVSGGERKLLVRYSQQPEWSVKRG